MAVPGARRRKHRSGAHGVPPAYDPVYLLAGRMRDGVHLLRHRPIRFRTPTRGRRDHRSGRLRERVPPQVTDAGVAAADHQRRVHGNGRTARELRPGARIAAPDHRRHGDGSALRHRLHRRRRSRDAPPRQRALAGEPRRQPPRRGRRSPQSARSPQRAIPTRRGHRRRRDVLRCEGQTRVDRVDAHRRSQRQRRPGSETGADRPQAARPRQPDRTQSDTPERRPALEHRPHRTIRHDPCAAPERTPPCEKPGDGRSMPPAVSFACVRPAAILR